LFIFIGRGRKFSQQANNACNEFVKFACTE
jgi:hypothetical protein